MVQYNRKRLLTYTSLMLLIVIFILGNVFNNLFFKAVRFDFSEQKIYTLSSGSKEILGEIKEPINIKLYFSKKLAQSYPYLVSYAARVQELLAQYQRASNNNVNINIIDTESFTETEDQAVNYGLQGIPIDGNGSELYFGLVATNSLTNKEVISFLQPTREAYLEYDISQMIYRLIYPEATKVGVLSDLPLQGSSELYLMQGGEHPWVIWEQLRQSFNVIAIAPNSEKIPDDIKVLLLANAGDISEQAAYMVDQFIMRGGHVLAFIDPQNKHHNNQPATTNEQKLALNNTQKLLQAWGVTIPEKVFACPKLAKKIKYNQGAKEYVMNYPIWVDVTAEYFDKDDILTSNLERLTFAAAGVIKNETKHSAVITPLITSDGDNMLVDVEKLRTYKENPNKLLNEYNTDNQLYVLAARITGKINSAFPTGLKNNKTHINSVKNSNIILFANTDMLQDQFWVNVQNFMGNRLYMPTSGNGGFILNAIDNLSGSNALISIRNRGTFARPFSTIQNLQSKSRIKFRMKEDTLMKNLEQTKQKLVELEQRKKESNSIAISVEQKHEEKIFRNELVVTRRQLRDVQRELNKDIERLEFVIKFANIVLMPLLVLLSGSIFWAYRMRTSRNRCNHILYRTIDIE